MKLAYFDCFSGISGDMTLGALLDAGCDLAHLRAELQSLTGSRMGTLRRKSLEKRHGRHLRQGQRTEDQQKHRWLTAILEILNDSKLDAAGPRIAPQSSSRNLAKPKPASTTCRSKKSISTKSAPWTPSSTSSAPASASSARHRQIRLLAAERRRRHRKNGARDPARSRSGHRGPAEREADLLQRRPARTRHANAAPRSSRRFAIHFGPQPPMTVSAIGYGAGTADLEGQPNVVRIMIGQPAEKARRRLRRRNLRHRSQSRRHESANLRLLPREGASRRRARRLHHARANEKKSPRHAADASSANRRTPMRSRR